VSEVQVSSEPSPQSSAQRRAQRRLTREDNRYHSEIRTEAVMQALASHNKKIPVIPHSTKRTSAYQGNQRHRDSRHESSSDDDSVYDEEANRNFHRGARTRDSGASSSSSFSDVNASPRHSDRERPRSAAYVKYQIPGNTSRQALADVMQSARHSQHISQPPDVTNNAKSSRQADRVGRGVPSVRVAGNVGMDIDSDSPRHQGKVAAKIQQLMNTLKRPKRKPLTEYFQEDDDALEAPPADPNAPKPEGSTLTPVAGDQLVVPSGLPRNLEAALHRYGSSTYKALAVTVLDQNGKPSVNLTYGKLLSKTQKVAYNLLNKVGQKGEVPIKPGDRVALVYPNNDPISFIIGFYGCIMAGVVPVPVEVPTSRRDAGGQGVGFMLGSLSCNYALTSEACLKGLAKTANGEVVQFRGWPRLSWLSTDSMSKLPKDWQPPPKASEDVPAYVEVKEIQNRSDTYSTSKDGSTVGVTVTRNGVLGHCRTLTVACNYTEGEVMVCVLDFKRSLTSCDAFLNAFQPKGLKPEAICPCASSSEALTVSVRRPGRTSSSATGRGILSMQGLSHGVVRVDTENSLTSLTLQDCGQVMPGATMVVVKVEGSPYLCKTDEVGELCVCASYTGIKYWGLQGITVNTFQGGLVFVCGSKEGLMQISNRRHNTDDIIATVLAVEPMKFIYRGRIAVFSIEVLKDERIVIIAEQRPDCPEEESFQWMSRVLQAVDSIHQVGVFCLALVPPNYLPKTPLGGIHLHETRKKFLEGSLHPANVLMCPHTCVTNLPKPREHRPDRDVTPSAVHVGNIVQGARMAWAQGRELNTSEEDGDGSRKHQFLTEILRFRAQNTPDHILFTLLNSKLSMSCSQLHKRAERIGNLLAEKGKLKPGDHVTLLYPPGIELIAAFYGCLYAGCVPVTIRPPHPQNVTTTLPTVKMIVEVSKSSAILTSANIVKLLRSKEALSVVDVRAWPTILDSDDLPKKKLTNVYKAPTPEMICYLDFSVSTTGMLAGVKMSHASATALCRCIKLQCEFYPSREACLCLDPYSGLGFALWCLASIYSGHHSLLVPPSEVEANPAVWLSAVSMYKVRDTFCSYGVMDLCTRGLGTSTGTLKAKGLNLSCVRICCVIAEERPRIHLTTSFTKLFADLGLSYRAVSTSFGCRGAACPEPSTVFVDLRALRNDRLLPGVKVAIANPETRGQCADSHLGESLHPDHFDARLATGDLQSSYARTGYLGFVRRTELTQSDGVVVVELDGNENEALDLVPLVTNCVLEEHYLIVGVVVVVDPGIIPINSRGEKQRMHLRDGFLADQLDPIYVAYNM
ncbi:DIP2C-like protein, partial [Mya arenaria]